MSEFGYGQMAPGDTASPYNAMMFVIQQALGRVRTAVLVQVVAVTNSGDVSPVGFVDAHPLVSQVDGLGNSTPHGTIFNLAYFRLQGGTNAIILDPQAGDIGIAVVADRDISAVKNTKAEANPGSNRRFSLADGIYVGGCLNGTPAQYVQFTGTGITVADANGNKIATGPLGVTVTGNLFVTGGIQAGHGGADAVSLQTHNHAGVQVGGGVTTPPTPGS